MIFFIESDYKAEFDMMLEEQVQKEIDAAKQEGLEVTRAVVKKWKHSKQYQWDILGVSAVTANKLINGEFKTFEELDKYNVDNRGVYKSINLLYRRIENKNRERYFNCLIETIFIDE